MASSDHANGETASVPGTAGVAVLEKLAALDVSRKADRDKRKEELISAADPRESIEQFLMQFNARLQGLDNGLQARLACHKEASTGSQAIDEKVSALAAGQALDQLSAEAFELERSVAEVSYFLPLYDQKQCNANISDLRIQIDDARTTLVPRRKFAFSKKVSRVKAEEASACSAPSSQQNGASASGSHQAFAGIPDSPLPSRAQQDASTSASISEAVVAGITERDQALIRSGRGFSGLRGQTLVRWADEIGSQDFVLADLADCTVFLLGHMPALRLLGLRRTRVYSGPVTGACFLDDVQGCTLAIAAYQMRIHRTHNTELYLRTRSRPIVEHCTGLGFAPYPSALLASPQLQPLLSQHRLAEETSTWEQVDDFGWIKSTQSPSWSILPEERRQTPPALPEQPHAVSVQSHEPGSTQGSAEAAAVDVSDEI